MMEVVNMLVYPNQIAFMKGRVIFDNTLLADEMLHGYGGARTPRRRVQCEPKESIQYNEMSCLILLTTLVRITVPLIQYV